MFRLLDLFSGAGGAAMGYHQALEEAGIEHEITGIDINPMPRYPFNFIKADALEYCRDHGTEYDFIHGSPPCQAFSMAGQQWRVSGKEYPDLIEITRNLIIQTRKPYVIENVPGAPLINPTILNGPFFGLNLRRTRLFETSFELPFILLPKEGKSRFRMGRPQKQHDPVVPVGHFSGVERAQRVMGINWMGQKELAQAIPPAYTKFIMRQFLEKS